MNKWSLPPLNEKLKEESINKEKKSKKEEPSIIQLGLMEKSLGSILKISIAYKYLEYRKITMSQKIIRF